MIYFKFIECIGEEGKWVKEGEREGWREGGREGGMEGGKERDIFSSKSAGM